MAPMKLGEAVIVALLVTGCESTKRTPRPTYDEVLAAVPAEARANLDRIAAIAAQLPAVDRQRVYAGAPLSVVLGDRKPTGDTVLLHAEDLVALDHLDTANVTVRVAKSNDIQSCWTHVKHKKNVELDDAARGAWRYGGDPFPEAIQSSCATAGHATFLAVIEEHATAADAHDDSKANTAISTFRGGEISGTLLVWNIGTGTYEGSIPFHAESSHRLEAEAPSKDRRGDNIDDVAAQDLSTHALDAVERALSRSGS
jgi:hypothetical protein